MRQTWTKCVLIIALCTSSSATANGNLITNGGFDSPDIGGRFITYTSAPAGFAWSITGSGGWGVDLCNSDWSGVSGTSNPDGRDQSVDVDFASTLAQSFVTAPNATYSISFWYSHNYNASESTGYVDVTGAANLLTTILTHNIPNSASNMEWSYFEDSFATDALSATLTFTGEYSNAKFGFAVDGVRVEEVSVVPVPGALMLGGIGIGVLGRLRKHRVI